MHLLSPGAFYLQEMQTKFPNNSEVKSVVHETEHVLALLPIEQCHGT